MGKKIDRRNKQDFRKKIYIIRITTTIIIITLLVIIIVIITTIRRKRKRGMQIMLRVISDTLSPTADNKIVSSPKKIIKR